jgi:hypothetical protein
MKDIQTILILRELLNGNRDLSDYIIRLKNKKQKERRDEFCSSQDFWIENNFYNWLNHDIVLRETLKIHGGMDLSLYESFYNYYNRNEDVLGLERFRRTRGLSECFNLPWWKTTVKSSIIWDDTHTLISKEIRVFAIIEMDENNGSNYYFESDLLIEKFGLQRLRYVNRIYKELLIHGGILFEDITRIFIHGDTIQFLE